MPNATNWFETIVQTGLHLITVVWMVTMEIPNTGDSIHCCLLKKGLGTNYNSCMWMVISVTLIFFSPLSSHISSITIS